MPTRRALLATATTVAVATALPRFAQVGPATNLPKAIDCIYRYNSTDACCHLWSTCGAPFGYTAHNGPIDYHHYDTLRFLLPADLVDPHGLQVTGRGWYKDSWAYNAYRHEFSFDQLMHRIAQGERNFRLLRI